VSGTARRLTALNSHDLCMIVATAAQGTNDFADSHADAGYSCDPAYAPLVAHRSAHRAVSSSMIATDHPALHLSAYEAPWHDTIQLTRGTLMKACRERLCQLPTGICMLIHSPQRRLHVLAVRLLAPDRVRACETRIKEQRCDCR